MDSPNRLSRGAVARPELSSDCLRSLVPMRPLLRRRRRGFVATATFLVVAGILGLSSAAAVLHPRVDSPARVDAIVVVADGYDDRYAYAQHLARDGVSDQILVSRPPGWRSRYATALDSYCGSAPVLARDGRPVGIDCFAPDVETTEGETTAAARIAHSRGWESLLVVTYWGHVTRVRIYFEECFSGEVHVTDTPNPTPRSRKSTLLHETGGYVKAFLKPAC